MNIYRHFYLKPELKLEGGTKKKHTFSLSAISNLFFFPHERERGVLADCPVAFILLYTRNMQTTCVDSFSFSSCYMPLKKKIPNLNKKENPLYCIVTKAIINMSMEAFCVFTRSQFSRRGQCDCCQDRMLPQKHWLFGWLAFSYDSIVIAFLMPASCAHH